LLARRSIANCCCPSELSAFKNSACSSGQKSGRLPSRDATTAGEDDTAATMNSNGHCISLLGLILQGICW
jgi:hypothetical protein